jgi:MFS family permease
MKLSRILLSYLKDPVEIWEQFNQDKLSRENFLLVVCCSVALGAFAQGFATVHTHLLLSDRQFLNSYQSWQSNQSDPFVIDNVQHFSSVLYWGEVIGALVSFPIIDTFGRKKTYLFASLVCALTFICQMLTSYLPNILTLRFITFGVIAVVAPIYVAEVGC